MKKSVIIVLGLILIMAGLWCFRGEISDYFEPDKHELTLYGNVDNRQLDLSFLLPERIAQIIPEEGSYVTKGMLVGSLETVRIENSIAAQKAVVAARKASYKASQFVCSKTKKGSRLEDIAIAHAIKSAIEAKIKAAEAEYVRLKTLQQSNVVSVQDKESAEAEYFFLQGGLLAVESYLGKLVSGERQEDIDAAIAHVEQAAAELAVAEAELFILEQQLKDTQLYAPCNGIIRNRLREPGEMTAPNLSVLTLAVVSPKWIRCYLNEPELILVKAGDKALIKFDGSEHLLTGWVGFISPNAEFTPKNIETQELRPNLVYEIRIYVDDNENKLKLGAPATVSFPGVMVK